MKPDQNKPQLLNASSTDLIKFLDHPNGWWRDQAQQILIIRNEQSIVPQLKSMVTGTNPPFKIKSGELAVVHALWTLEGLGAIDKEVLSSALTHQHPQVRKAAVWVSEQYIKQQDLEVIQALAKLKNDPSADVKFQLSL